MAAAVASQRPQHWPRHQRPRAGWAATDRRGTERKGGSPWRRIPWGLAVALRHVAHGTATNIGGLMQQLGNFAY